MSISLVVALGNPGRDYADTRHNLGWILLDAYARKKGFSFRVHSRFEAEVARWDRAPGSTLWCAKPLTFMNESGRSVGALLRFHKLEPQQVLVIHDDLNLELGTLKISERGSAGGHNGVASLIQHLGESFVRFRLGIGPKTPAQMDLVDFVLGTFTPEQKTLLDQSIEKLINGLDLLLTQGLTQAMNQLNRRPSS